MVILNIMNETVFSLYEFNQLIKETIYFSFPEFYLITAEIASIRYDNKGHCYIGLVEKDNITIRAQISARIWAPNSNIILEEFRRSTGINLSKGIKILIKASLNFHERYGVSLIIQNIDPSYTIGEMARKRKEIIKRRTEEGFLNRNKEIHLPLVPQNIAVISSKQAAGYEDFIKHLINNPYGYRFSIKLYETIMQGEKMKDSFLKTLTQCEMDKDNIDIVVIVRGGGTTADLDSFDSYDIGKTIALMSRPVIAGIGHERDSTVIDEVSHTSVKTPTAAANRIIDKLREFEDTLDELTHKLIVGVQNIKEDYLRNLFAVSTLLESTARSIIAKNRYNINYYSKSLINNSPRLLSRINSSLATIVEKFNLLMKKNLNNQHKDINDLSSILLKNSKKFIVKLDENLNTKINSINHLNPQNIIKRGYSITYHNNKVLKSAANVSKGSILKTLLYQGNIKSKVTDIEE